MINRRQILATMTTAAGWCALRPAGAETFPSRAVRIVVPFSAGGFTDTSIRIIAARMSEDLGVPLVVDNRAGSNGVVGATLAAKAPPDGYTMLWGHSGVFAVNPALYPNLPYAPLRDFVPLTLAVRTDLYLVVNPAMIKAMNLQGLLREIEALPEASPLRNYASVGTGSTHHLAMELLKVRTGARLTHVPYKGAAPALQDLIAGRVPMMFSAYSSVAQFVQQGRLRVIANARSARSSELPDVPTVSEQGVSGFDVWGWLALALPAGTPEPVLARLHAAYANAVNDPVTRRRLVDAGADVLLTSSAEAAEQFKSEAVTWAGVVKAARITMDS